MNFQEKNFKYITKEFGAFIDDIVSGQPEYLRSLSSINSADNAANFAFDYPSIAQDFKIPPELELVMTKFHSSVLRVSGPVTMWLHYDVSIEGHRR